MTGRSQFYVLNTQQQVGLIAICGIINSDDVFRSLCEGYGISTHPGRACTPLVTCTFFSSSLVYTD